MNNRTIYGEHSRTIGLIGYGSFGKLLAIHISRYVQALIYSPSLSPESSLPKNCHYANLKDLAAKSDLVILAINLEHFQKLLETIAPYLKPGTTVMDVCSVKVKPVELMQKYLPKNIQILATHPVFGPQSAGTGPEGLAGHKIMMHPVRINNPQHFALLKLFLASKLKLGIIEMTPQEHDRHMATVHALTFFLARGLMKMDLAKDIFETPTYKKLTALAELEKHHTKELFNTIEAGNPFAAEVRQKMLDVLTKLHKETIG
jgi:prephenate dehydrogenase